MFRFREIREIKEVKEAKDEAKKKKEAKEGYLKIKSDISREEADKIFEEMFKNFN